MRKYKVGDIVRVRSDLQCGHSYGGVGVNSRMERLSGQDVTIACYSSQFYQIVEDTHWTWSEEMFDGLASEFYACDIEFSAEDVSALL